MYEGIPSHISYCARQQRCVCRRGERAYSTGWFKLGLIGQWRIWRREDAITRVNSTNILDEGLRIGGRGRRMNSKVKVQTNKAKLDPCRE
jgi:hypothetical protein